MNDEDKEFLDELKQDFIEETTDLLQKCESSLLNYEKKFEETYFNEYMRTLHSIKGSARAVEFDTFASTIHLIEGLGQKSRDGVFVEKSLSSIDGLKDSLESMKQKDLDEADAILKTVVHKISA